MAAERGVDVRVTDPTRHICIGRINGVLQRMKPADLLELAANLEADAEIIFHPMIDACSYIDFFRSRCEFGTVYSVRKDRLWASWCAYQRGIGKPSGGRQHFDAFVERYYDGNDDMPLVVPCAKAQDIWSGVGLAVEIDGGGRAVTADAPLSVDEDADVKLISEGDVVNPAGLSDEQAELVNQSAVERDIASGLEDKPWHRRLRENIDAGRIKPGDVVDADGNPWRPGERLAQPSEAQKHEALTEMRRSGGGFVKALAEAWQHADPDNSRRLHLAFGDIFARYLRIASEDEAEVNPHGSHAELPASAAEGGGA